MRLCARPMVRPSAMLAAQVIHCWCRVRHVFQNSLLVTIYIYAAMLQAPVALSRSPCSGSIRCAGRSLWVPPAAVPGDLIAALAEPLDQLDATAWRKLTQQLLTAPQSELCLHGKLTQYMEVRAVGDGGFLC